MTELSETEQIQNDPNFIHRFFAYLASTRIGQFFLKKVDSLLWTLERPMKYTVQEERMAECKKVKFSEDLETSLPWIVFWFIFINMHLCRIVFSWISVTFGKQSIDSEAVVRVLQKWRRHLRSIRHEGMRAQREHGSKKTAEADTSRDSRASPKRSRKKLRSDMLDYEALNDLMNRTFLESDNSDSTFTVSRLEDDVSESMSSSETSHTDNMDDVFSSSTIASDNLNQSLDESMKIEATSESENLDHNVSLKTDESTAVTDEENTFQSTVSDYSSDIPRKDSSQIAEPKTIQPKPETTKPEETENGKQALNQYGVDPADALMAKLVQFQKENNLNFLGKPIHKKKANSVGDAKSSDPIKSGKEMLNVPTLINKSKSQEQLQTSQKN